VNGNYASAQLSGNKSLSEKYTVHVAMNFRE